MLFSGVTGGISNECLDGLSRWLGLGNSFANQSRYKKQSYVPIEMTIANFDEVEKELKGTRFEYCLLDEESYRNRKPDARLDSPGDVIPAARLLSPRPSPANSTPRGRL